jgi:hypothetical protein
MLPHSRAQWAIEMFPRLLPGPVRHCFNYLHHYGLRITLRDALPYLRELIFRRERQLERVEDFDSRFATNTASPVWPWDLPSIRASSPEVHGYEAVPVQGVREALRRLPLESFAFTFVDLGSGKGRALLVASEFPLAKIVGVELSAELHAIAEKNIELYRPHPQPCRKFQLVMMDAAEYAFPPEPLVLFMYSPFGEKTMQRVLANLQAALQRSRQPAYVIYVNPQLARLLEVPFLRKLPSPAGCALYEACLPAA